MTSIVAGNTTSQLGITRIVSSVVVNILRPGVVRHYVESTGKALVEFQLQRVVVITGIAAVIP